MTPTRTLYALTLHRPWPALIAHGFKPIENREWSPAGFLRPGQWIAIHAGKTWDDTCIPFAVSLGVPEAFFTDANRVESAIVGVARYDGVTRSSTSPWFFGTFGWMFGKAVAIEPVPCRGRQKLWAVPMAEAALVRSRYRAALPVDPDKERASIDAMEKAGVISSVTAAEQRLELDLQETAHV